MDITSSSASSASRKVQASRKASARYPAYEGASYIGYRDERFYEDYREGEKQYTQNPKGLCEDAPCCGCCGY